MKIGDKVKMSDRNPNHLGNGVDAYAGMEGLVTDIYDDGAFVLNCRSCLLSVSMNKAWKQPREGVWIWLNGEHIFHKRIDTKPTISTKKWFQWFIPKNLLKFKFNTKFIACFYLLLVVVFFIGCNESNVNKNNTGVILTNGGSDVKIIVIDSCEYLYYSGESRMGMAHKGNCKFCLARHAK